jgi:hypothetical protein
MSGEKRFGRRKTKRALGRFSCNGQRPRNEAVNRRICHGGNSRQHGCSVKSTGDHGCGPARSIPISMSGPFFNAPKNAL